jgi:hypothetical protein
LEPGTYAVGVEQAATAAMGGSFDIETSRSRLVGEVKPTGDAAVFETTETGEAEFAEPGVYQLVLNPVEITGDELMVLRSVTLTRRGS